MNDSIKMIKSDIPIRSFVTKRLIGVYMESTVQEAARKMVEFNISSLVVLDKEGVIGFFTDADIKEKVVAEGLKPDITVDKIMNTNLIATDINTKVRDVLGIMSEKSIKHILITERGEIVGIVTFRDLIDMERRKLETHISRE